MTRCTDLLCALVGLCFQYWKPRPFVDLLHGLPAMQMQGQDSLEVRSVTLANGQKASLILEEGRLQRIVAANGQVAELRWNPPALNRATRPSNHLSVRVHRGIQG